MPQLHFTPGKDPVPILQEAGWAPGLVWTCRKSCPHQDSIPDRPGCSQLLYQLSYPDKVTKTQTNNPHSIYQIYTRIMKVGVMPRNNPNLSYMLSSHKHMYVCIHTQRKQD